MFLLDLVEIANFSFPFSFNTIRNLVILFYQQWNDENERKENEAIGKWRNDKKINSRKIPSQQFLMRE